jgi:hypothetical protein
MPGGEWVDQEVVTDHGLVTRRKPDEMIEEITQAKHQVQHA